MIVIIDYQRRVNVVLCCDLLLIAATNHACSPQACARAGIIPAYDRSRGREISETRPRSRHGTCCKRCHVRARRGSMKPVAYGLSIGTKIGDLE